MLSEAGAKIYLVKNEGNLELNVNAFEYEVEKELKADLKTEAGLNMIK